MFAVLQKSSSIVALLACFLASAQVLPQSLLIAVIAGEGQTNNVRQRTAREPIIEVRDQNNKPVAGASVLFTLPQSGPGGAFANGARTFTGLTNSAGRITATGFQPNTVTGSFQIQVSASYQGLTANAVISQVNALVAAAAAGAAAGAAGAAGAGAGTTTAVVAGVAAAAGGVAIGTIAAVADDEPPVSPSQP